MTDYTSQTRCRGCRTRLSDEERIGQTKGLMYCRECAERLERERKEGK